MPSFWSEKADMPSKRRRYEGSKQDIAEDKRGAAKRGMSLRQYERTAKDKAEDRRGQARLDKRK
jgi:hypothetical protein